MTKRVNYYIAVNLGVLSILSLLQSCTEPIDLDLDSSYIQCVIYGEITTDTTSHKVRITKSADYFRNKPSETISGATVTITDGINTFPLSESATEPGNYYTASDVYGLPNNTYTLSVSNVDLLGNGELSSYTASSDLRPVSAIDSIDTEYISIWKWWEIKVWAKDPAESIDYYMFKVYINGVLNADSLRNLEVVEDKFFNGNFTNGIPVYRVEGKDTIKTNDLITLDICGITKEYFHFVTEAKTMINPQIPLFSGPPANVRTNISNDALGFFTAYSISTNSRRVGSKKR